MTSLIDPRSVLSIIPARGGSKGIARKNLVLLAGRPLLAHSTCQALAARHVGRVVVSTDDQEIARVALASGAEVIERPPELATDEATSEAALLHVLDQLAANDGYEPALVVFLQATSPLRSPDAIDRAVEQLVAEGADSLFSACPAHGFVWRRQRGALRALTYDSQNRPRRQDIGEDFLENGSIYVFRTQTLRRCGNRLGGKITVFPMDPLESFQLDEPADLALFEQLFALRSVERLHRTVDLARVRLLALDFDGVLTDNRVMVGEDGSEAVHCSRGDGLGIERLQAVGVEVIVLSKERNLVVAARCRKLRIDCVQSLDDKLPTLRRLAAERGLEASEVAYVGNDVNDLPCLEWAGVAIAVSDAEPEVRRAASALTTRLGGQGAVREICEWLISAVSAAQSGRQGASGPAVPR